MRDYQELVETARKAALVAAEYIRGADRKSAGEWGLKGRRDFVTEVDLRSEELIRQSLSAAYPESSFMGEELSPGPTRPEGLLWIVDPLDGTTNFLHGYPWYAVSIAALLDGDLVAGVVVNVAYGTVYQATKGGGAWHDGRRLAVSQLADPDRALIGTGFPFRDLSQLGLYLRQFAAVSRAAGAMRRAGSAALDLVDVALGRFDAFWELSLAPWDIAAGTLIVREAGGCVTDLQGADPVLRHGSVVAGNPAMHAWLLALLREE
ncbi:MAG: inositol monophosphatase [Gemmatimonadales bacterium]|nr:Inositol-1-monophosphatase [bacterium HR33]GIW51646.1 MAG: inositol monophosphatase [Gemmatimonadales bacterium]